MSLKTMPILFLNMGGEMCYILDQRLHAQSVRSDKSVRVMSDIVGTMFNKKFLEELFKPQELYSRRNMRAFFEKLAHASIMRLNATSMDKLYDLMTMAVKYQLQMCTCPRDVLLVTLNHMDGIRKLVHSDQKMQPVIDYAYDLLETHFFTMPAWELQLLRTTLLGFYQDARVKVSLLLRHKRQKDDGRFILFTGDKIELSFGATAPGTINYYKNGGVSKTVEFTTRGAYHEVDAQGSLERAVKKGGRVITYGTNMYKNGNIDVKGGYGSSAADSSDAAKEDSTKNELKLLSKLIGNNSKTDQGDENDFALSFFETPEDETTFVKNANVAKDPDGKVVKIDASKRDKRSIEKMVGDMGVKERKPKKEKGQDMLDMMDEAEERPGTSGKSRARTASAKGTRPRSSVKSAGKRRSASKHE